jgi:phosphoglycolate phosphatase
MPLSLIPATLQAVIVDLDGTMVDTVGDFEVALRLTLADLGWPPVGRDFIGRTVGKGSEHLLTRTLAEVGAPADLHQRAWQLYQQHYLDINGQHSAVFPGVVEVLQALRARGLRLACLTNKPQAFAQPLLALKGLDIYFDHTFGGDAFARKKPDPLPLLETCKALGSTPATTLMVGDSRNDAEAARAAGCAVVLVSYGCNHGEPAASAKPDAVVDSLVEVAALIEAAEHR